MIFRVMCFFVFSLFFLLQIMSQSIVVLDLTEINCIDETILKDM